MNKVNILKLTIGILIFAVIILSVLVFRNYQEGYGCMDCITERTLSGEWYDGWQKLSDLCAAYNFDRESSLECFSSNLHLEVGLEDITRSEIKIPSLKIFNTVLISKNLPAFIIEGGYCKPSFAITSEGNIFSTGGCLG